MPAAPVQPNDWPASSTVDPPSLPISAEPTVANSPAATDIAPSSEHHAAPPVVAEMNRSSRPREPIAQRGQPPWHEAPQDDSDASRSLSLSIGRIDVEFVQPPAPVTPPMRQAPERTRGFARYSAIRRGLPR
jgi:hypothetical protein